MEVQKSARNKVTAVIGAMWGDEGKGKLVDVLCGDADIVARSQGGNNAGHTVVADGVTYYCRLLPTGILRGCLSVLGNGTVIHVPTLFKEIEKLGINDWTKKLIISDRAHMLFGFHMVIDGQQEAARKDNQLGTTRKGIGPAYTSKISRIGLRMGDLLRSDFKLFREKYFRLFEWLNSQFSALESYDTESELKLLETHAGNLRKAGTVQDTVFFLNQAIDNHKKIVIEGAQATLLDIDFGTYPYVTSSNCSVGGVCTGLGIAPGCIGETIGCIKAYLNRAGDGPFPSELCNVTGEKLREAGHEWMHERGAPLRVGWLDLILLKQAEMINRFSSLYMSKLDVLDEFEEICVVVKYKNQTGDFIETVPSTAEELFKMSPVYKSFPGWLTDTTKIKKFCDLPSKAKDYVRFIEDFVGAKVKYLGNGPDRESLIKCDE